MVCSCGAVYTTGSTKPELRVEICNQCHPFFTGEQRIVDTAGRVERFRRRYANAQQKQPESTDEVAAPVETAEAQTAETDA